MGQKTKIGYK